MLCPETWFWYLVYNFGTFVTGFHPKRRRVLPQKGLSEVPRKQATNVSKLVRDQRDTCIYSYLCRVHFLYILAAINHPQGSEIGPLFSSIRKLVSVRNRPQKMPQQTCTKSVQHLYTYLRTKWHHFYIKNTLRKPSFKPKKVVKKLHQNMYTFVYKHLQICRESVPKKTSF